jgi:hypothetical protein
LLHGQFISSGRFVAGSVKPIICLQKDYPNLGHIAGMCGLFLDRFAVPNEFFGEGMHHAHWFRKSALKNIFAGGSSPPG